MTAVYIQGPIVVPEQHNRPFPHTRNLSTVSSTTLHPSSSDHSQPTEPLLHQPITEHSSTTFHDVPERPPVIPEQSFSAPTWERTITLDGDAVSRKEKKGLWELAARRRLKRLQLFKRALEWFIGSWTIYNTVMYFLAFSMYNSSEGQAISLALGISTGVSFAFLACAVVLSFFRSRLLAHHFPIWMLDRLRTVLRYLSSLCVLGPAAVNLAMVNVIRHSSDNELRLNTRCHFDIDAIWSASSNPCVNKSPVWGVWLAVALVRIILTFAVLIFYHLSVNSYERNRQPHARRRRSRRRRHQSHHRSESYQTSIPSAAVSPHSTNTFVPQIPHDVHRQVSESTFSTKFSDPGSHYQSRMDHSRSAGFSDEEHAQNIIVPYPRPDGPTPMDSSGSLPAQTEELVRESPRFADRFRTMINQIARETEEAIESARSDAASRSTVESSTYEDDLERRGNGESEGDEEDEGMYYRGPVLPPVLGYDELGNPYPADEYIPMMGDTITRMPTIESVGSREIGSSMYSSERSHVRAGSSAYNGSRPPTRNTLLSWNTELSSSQPPSRANSLSARVGLMLATSEVGELLVMNPTNPRGSAGTTGSESGSGSDRIETPPSGENAPSSTAASRSTYYTATTGSRTSGNSIPERTTTPPPPMPQLGNAS